MTVDGPETPGPAYDDALDSLHSYMEHRRWFAGKGRDFRITGTTRLPLTDHVTVELVAVAYEDEPADPGEPAAVDLYQVPVSYYDAEQEHLEHAHIGFWDDPDLGPVHAYDAAHDHEAMSLWLAGFVGEVPGAREDTPLTFHRIGEPELDPGARSALMSAEQSNTSVAFGESGLMKLFRRVTPGVNPDVEMLNALTLSGSEHVPALYGYVEVASSEIADADEPLQLGILQQFLRTASDGWDLALVSLRNLYAEPDMPAHLAGGDFAGEAHRLGVAVGAIHGDLADAFPTEEWGPQDMARLADEMLQRLREAGRAVPEVAELEQPLGSLLDAVRHATPVRVQRVHGDLHLGQTLRTVKGWKVIDFEGEPAKTLAQRRRLDSVWRDVAGMVRSFDYAAELTRRDHLGATGDVDHTDRVHAREWAQRNVTAFLAGYDEATGHDEVDHDLLTAYAVDKAVYEAVYEARNRPTWLPIPLAALRRLSSRT